MAGLGGAGRWLQASLRSIDDSPALRAYAVILSLMHALTGISWFSYKHVAENAGGSSVVCWPTLPHCEDVRSRLSPEGVRDLVILYVVLGLVAAGAFWLRRIRPALVTFVCATLLGTFVYALDYRLRSNETYMFSWCVAVLLFAPRKHAALQATVALFYFWAGTLKVNADWMSGAALYQHPYLVPEALIPASCVYVLFLEMALVWGLFSTSPRVRWAVYAQLLLFHAVSWKVVGYHYPLLMFGLTGIYPLVWRLVPGETLTLSAVRADPRTRWTVTAVASLFSAIQLVPRLREGDSVLTGEGRVFALHMFDGRIVCEGAATLHGGSGQYQRVDLVDPKLTERTRCDPVFLLAAARRVCGRAAGHGDATRVDVAVDARRATDPEMHPLMHIEDFCSKSIEYSAWHHNDWIGR